MKYENMEETDGNVKKKKLKTNKQTAAIRRTGDFGSGSESSTKGGKHNIKNTYINKINTLISEQKPSKAEEK
jgi:hypothetical protein